MAVLEILFIFRITQPKCEIPHLLTMRCKKLLFTSLLLLSCYLASSAQSFISSEGKHVLETRGRVVDRDRVPIPETRLNIHGPDIDRSAKTDQDGFFRIDLPPA